MPNSVVMTPFVNNEPTGVAEELLWSGRDQLFAGWKKMQLSMTPVTAMDAFGHIEHSKFYRPGDAATVVGMATAGVQAGTPIANDITMRNDIVAQNAGESWNTDPIDDRTPADIAKAQLEQDLLETATAQSFLPGSEQFNQIAEQARPENDSYTLWGGTKGLSRWAFAALDVPFVHGADAFARIIAHNDVSQYQGVPSMYAGMDSAERSRTQMGMLSGSDPRGSNAFAVPFLSYARAGIEGERINMGSGFFAQGDFSDDVVQQVAQFEGELEGITGFDYEQMRGPDGKVWVQGAAGQRIPTDNLDDYLKIQDTAGRAGLVDTAMQTSPLQAGLGTPYGSLADDVFQDGVYGVDKNGNYYQATIGRVLTAEVLQMDSTTFASKAVSGTMDFSKHLLDLPIFKAAKGAAKAALNVFGWGGNKLVGLAGEVSDLRRANDTVDLVGRGLGNADERASLARQLNERAIDRDMAINGVARSQDQALQDAATTTAQVKARGLKNGLDETQVDDLIRRAENGEYAAGQWFKNTLGEIHTDKIAVAKQLSNWETVLGRGRPTRVRGPRPAGSTLDDLPDLNAETMQSGQRLVDQLEDSGTVDLHKLLWDDELTAADLADDLGIEAIDDATFDAARRIVMEDSQFALREQFGDTITVYRSGDVRAGRVESTSLNKSTAETFGEPVAYQVDVDDVLYYSDAVTPGGTFAEAEVGIRGEVLEEAATHQRALDEFEGISLIDGRYGDSTAYIDDEVLGRIAADVDELDDILRNRSASVVLDAEGRPVVTFDADLADAQQTMRELTERQLDEALDRSVAADRSIRLQDELRELDAEEAVGFIRENPGPVLSDIELGDEIPLAVFADDVASGVSRHINLFDTDPHQGAWLRADPDSGLLFHGTGRTLNDIETQGVNSLTASPVTAASHARAANGRIYIFHRGQTENRLLGPVDSNFANRGGLQARPIGYIEVADMQAVIDEFSGFARGHARYVGGRPHITNADMRAAVDQLGQPKVKVHKIPTSERLGQEVASAQRKSRRAVVVDELDRIHTGPHRLDWTNRPSVEKAARAMDENVIDANRQQLGTNLFNDTWTARQWAEQALTSIGGRTPSEARRLVDNLVRVLRRHDTSGDFIKGASEWNQRFDPRQLSRLFTGGDPRIRNMFADIASANTHADMWKVLAATVQSQGRKAVPPQLVDRLVNARTIDEVGAAMLEMGQGVYLVPNKIRFYGDWARTAGRATWGGQLAGATAGFLQGGLAGGEPEQGWDWGDAFGGAFTGGFLGRRATSFGVGAVGLYRRGVSLSRTVDDVADLMDVLLAGSRAATANNIRTVENARQAMSRSNVPGFRGMQQTQDNTRYWDQLSRPVQFSSAFGHLPTGRLLAKEANIKVSLNDPADLYHKMREYARNWGLRGDERIVQMSKKADDGSRTVERLYSSQYRTMDEYEAAKESLKAAGYKVTKEADMAQVFSDLAQLQPNNTAAGYRALESFFDVVDVMLVNTSDLPDHLRRVATRFTEDLKEDFLSNVDAVGTPVALQQMAVNGRIVDVSDAPLLTSEMWAGNIHLPDPNVVRRAVARTHTLGKVTTTLTGKGVAPAVMRKLAKQTPDVDWATALNPEFERNVATRAVRFAISGLSVPLVLLTRPLAFAQRVFIDDQMRMAAGGLGSWTPASPLAWLVGNWQQWSRRLGGQGRFKYATARADSAGAFGDVWDPDLRTLDEDVLDGMSQWDVDDMVQQDLRIYNRDDAKRSGQLVYGVNKWQRVARDEDTPRYLDGLVRELRQLVRDPIAARLAQRPPAGQTRVQATYNWLRNSQEGQEVLANWGRQFRTPEEAAEFMEGDNLLGFLEDLHARLHLKTGGDWVFVRPDGSVVSSKGSSAGPVRNAEQWREAGPGYHIVREGDPEMLDMVATSKIGSRRLTGDPTPIGPSIGDEAMEVLDEFVRSRFQWMERRYQSLVDEGAGDDVLEATHRFPEYVKGVDNLPVDLRKVRSLWDKTLELAYDMLIGGVGQRFSREPVLGSHFWERVAMLMPQMTDDVAEAWMTVARKENAIIAERVEKIARSVDEAGMNAKVIDDFYFVHDNAKAYAVEKLNQTLFDLHQQRNIIDSLRTVAPFAGPMVEAFENWARVLRRRPVTVWRRGLQIHRALWDMSPVAPDREDDPLGASVLGGGGFYTNRETGEEMIRYPFSGRITRFIHDNLYEGVSPGPIDARLRGFNVVFGPDNFRDEDTVRLPGAGVPVTAFNPGASLAVQLPVGRLLRDRGGMAGTIYDVLFEYGEGEPVAAELTPYHLQRLGDSIGWAREMLGENSQQRFVASVDRQLEQMISTGEIGEGTDYDWENDPVAVERAIEEASRRAVHESIFEFILRGFATPTAVTPKPGQFIEVDQLRDAGVPNPERFLPLEELAREAADLVSADGAELLVTKDGYQISTEGDYEVATQYLNQKYGMNIFSAEFLNMPVTSTKYDMLQTASGLAWARDREFLWDQSTTRSSGFLLQPGYDQRIELEEFDYEARDYAIEQGWIDEQQFPMERVEAIEATLLDATYRSIRLKATELFGPDDSIEGDEQDRKDQWVASQQAIANGKYDRASIDQSRQEKVRNELLEWDTVDWQSMGLTPDEMATVRAVNWYIATRDYALNLLNQRGVTKLSHKGGNAEEQEFVQTVRQELAAGVEAQIQLAREQGVDMGNFAYIYETYLSSEFDSVPDYDPLEALIAIQRGDWQYVDQGDGVTSGP